MTSHNPTRLSYRILLATAGVLLLVATGAALAKNDDGSNRQATVKSSAALIARDNDHDRNNEHAKKREDKDRDGDESAKLRKNKDKDKYAAEQKPKCGNFIVPTTGCPINPKDPVGSVHPAPARVPYPLQ
jgi:hypothetical protein